MTTLYEKKISPAGKVTYHEYLPEMTDRDVTENQAMSLVAMLTMNLMENYKKQIPEHRRNARLIGKMVELVKELVPREEFDDEFASHIADCWNLAFMLMSKGAK